MSAEERLVGGSYWNALDIEALGMVDSSGMDGLERLRSVACLVEWWREKAALGRRSVHTKGWEETFLNDGDTPTRGEGERGGDGRMNQEGRGGRRGR